MKNSQRAIMNAIGGSQVREVERNGRTWLEFPIVPVKEMVMDYPEQDRREYLPKRSIQNSVEKWSDLPIRPTHPQRQPDGSATAKTAASYMESEVGRTYDPELAGNGDRIRNWGRVDVNKALEMGGIHEELVEGLRAGEVFPVSSGYDTTGDRLTQGSFDGESYDLEQGDLDPDHIAVIVGDEDDPMTPQARASVADGVGAPRLNAEKPTESEHAVDPARTPQLDDEQAASVGRSMLDAFGLSGLLGYETETTDRGRRTAGGDGDHDSDGDAPRKDDDPAGSGAGDEPDESESSGDGLPAGTTDDGSGSDAGLGPSDVGGDGKSLVDRLQRGGRRDMNEEEREEAIETMSASDEVPFDRDTLEAMDDDQLETVKLGYDADNATVEDDDGSTDDPQSTESAELPDGADGGDGGEKATADGGTKQNATDGDRIDRLEQTVQDLSEQIEEANRSPHEQVLRERTTLPDSAIEAMDMDEMADFVDDLPGDGAQSDGPLPDGFVEGVGQRSARTQQDQPALQQEIMGGGEQSGGDAMAMAPTGQTRQNAMHQSEESERSDSTPLSGRSGYEQRNGGDDE